MVAITFTHGFMKNALGCSECSSLGRPLGKTLWLHASSVSQSVSQSVCQTFSIHFLHHSYLLNAKMDQVHIWCVYAL